VNRFLDRKFLQQVDQLKGQTFTNEKIAETLKCSTSTVKRALREINHGALISSLKKFFMSGDQWFLSEELAELAEKMIEKRDPKILRSSFKRSMLEIEKARRFRERGYRVVALSQLMEPTSKIEKIWLKEYKKEWERPIVTVIERTKRVRGLFLACFRV
jgi:predicted transcriptional regulator